MARDLAILSVILLRRHPNGEDGDKSEEALACIKQAINLFGQVGAVQEFFECTQQKRRMKGQKLLDESRVWMPDPDYNNLRDNDDEDHDMFLFNDDY